MLSAKKFAGAALACWVAITGASTAFAQAPDRQDKRDDRRDPVQEKRDDRRGEPVQDRRDDRRDDRRGDPVQIQEGTRAVETRTGEARTGKAHRAKSVLGAKVSIRGDLAIGTVEDIVFTDDGTIDYLVVVNEGKNVLVPWEAAKFDFDKRTASVNITQERFREVPTFTEAQWSTAYEPAFQQRVYTSYGLRPRDERRIERREGNRRP